MDGFRASRAEIDLSSEVGARRAGDVHSLDKTKLSNKCICRFRVLAHPESVTCEGETTNAFVVWVRSGGRPDRRREWICGQVAGWPVRKHANLPPDFTLAYLAYEWCAKGVRAGLARVKVVSGTQVADCSIG